MENLTNVIEKYTEQRDAKIEKVEEMEKKYNIRVKGEVGPGDEGGDEERAAYAGSARLSVRQNRGCSGESSHSHKKRWPLVPPTSLASSCLLGTKTCGRLFYVLIREVTHEREQSTEDID